MWSILSQLLVSVVLLSSHVACQQENRFINPPEAGPAGQYRDIAVYPVGTQMTLSWTTSWERYSLVLYQNDNSSFHYLPASEGITAITFPWTCEVDGLFDLRQGNVFFFAIFKYESTNESFLSQYFNITDNTVDAQGRVISEPSSSTTSSSTSATSPSTSETSTPTPPPSDLGSSNRNVKIGAGVGAGVGSAVVLAAAVLFLLRRRRRAREALRLEKSAAIQAPAPPAPQTALPYQLLGQYPQQYPQEYAPAYVQELENAQLAEMPPAKDAQQAKPPGRLEMEA